MSTSSASAAPLFGVILAGPSGVGKDTVVKRLLERCPWLTKSITATTRAERPGEAHGQHYLFIRGHEAFKRRVANGEFVEHALVHNRDYYGLHWAGLEAARARGTPLVILDVQGVALVRPKLPVVTVFLTAPVETITRRISAGRPAAEIADRMASVTMELAQASTFDLVVSNDDGELDRAVESIATQLEALAPRFAAGRTLPWPGPRFPLPEAEPPLAEPAAVVAPAHALASAPAKVLGRRA